MSNRCILRIGSARVLSAVLVTAAGAAAPAWGAALYYDVVPTSADIDGGAANWSDSNWKAAPGDTAGGAWVAGSDARFNPIVVGGPTAAVTLTAPASANSLAFGGAGYSIGGASALTISGAAGVAASESAALTAPIIVTTADQTWTVASGKTLTVGNLTFDSRTLYMAGAGQVVLSGSSYSGNGGSFRANGNGTAVFSSGNLTTTGAHVLAGSTTPGAIIWNSTGTLNPGVRLYVGFSGGAGTFTQTAGLVTDGSSGFEFNCNNSTYNLNSGTLRTIGFNLWEQAAAGRGTYTGCVLNFGGGTLQAAATSVDGNANSGGPVASYAVGAGKTAAIDTQSFNVTLNGAISGASASGLAKSGSGTLTLGGSNSYAGTTTVSAGTLKLGHNSAAGGSSLSVSGVGGGAVDLNGKTIGNAMTAVYRATGPGNGGCLVNSDAANTAVVSGDIALGGNNYVGGAGNVTLNGLISGGVSGTGNDYAVYQQGTGTWTLSHPGNTFDGWWYLVNGGTTVVTKLANLNQASSLGRATDATRNRVFFTNSGGTLRYAGSTASTCDRGIVIGATANVIDASGTDAAATLTLTGVAESPSAGARTLTLTGNNGGVNTYQGSIGNGSGTSVALVKNGSTTWALAGANTYTGATTVNAGTLQLRNGALTVQRTALTLAGGTLENAAGAANDLGTLVTTGSNRIVVGAGSSLTFANSSALAGSWTGTISIQGTLVDGVTLRVGTTGAGLAASQLNRISNNGGPVTITAAGYLVRQPQGSWIAIH